MSTTGRVLFWIVVVCAVANLACTVLLLWYGSWQALSNLMVTLFLVGVALFMRASA